MSADTKCAIRTYNNIAREGLEVLSESAYQVTSDADEPIAILLRSHDLKAAEVPDSVCAIARAGSGVNNIPVEEMTERGIVVFNAPGANANSVSEIVVAALLIQARWLFLAANFVDSLESSAGDDMEARIEAEKKQFRGTELRGAKLGVVGLGAIGSRVAQLGLGLGMQVLGYDPGLTVENAWQLPRDVERIEQLDDLVSVCDYITLHMPVLDATRGLVDTKLLEKMPRGACLLNFARAAVVNSEAVIEALESGQLNGYATDFPTGALVHRARSHADVQLFPHLGASTSNAEANSAVMAAQQLRDFLQRGVINNSVNFPQLFGGVTEIPRIAIANRNIPRMLGLITAALADSDINVLDLVNHSRGEMAFTLVSTDLSPRDEVIDSLRAIEGVLSVRVLGTLG